MTDCSPKDGIRKDTSVGGDWLSDADGTKMEGDGEGSGIKKDTSVGGERLSDGDGDAVGGMVLLVNLPSPTIGLRLWLLSCSF